MNKDSLGNRMRFNYEARTALHLPRRTNTVIRLNIKNFSKYLKVSDAERPFDTGVVRALENTAVELCKNVYGVACAYVHGNEIDLLLSDFNEKLSEAWFDGNVQEQVSVSASIATAFFNKIMFSQGCNKLAFFGARSFTIPDRVEVWNYFHWRMLDAERNSVMQLALNYFPLRDISLKKVVEIEKMLEAKKVFVKSLPSNFYRGSMVYRDSVDRKFWNVDDNIPAFYKNRKYLFEFIPDYRSPNVASEQY